MLSVAAKTTKRAARIERLRDEAIAHGDVVTAELCAAALAGDAQAAAKVDSQIRDAAARSRERAPRRSSRRTQVAPCPHPFAHDEE
jgi:hypothetical protein